MVWLIVDISRFEKVMKFSK